MKVKTAKIVIHGDRKTQLSQNLLKTMSNFFFCQAHLGINVYYREKKFKKVEKQKFKLALKLLKKSWKSRKIQRSLFFKMVDFWHFFVQSVFCICILSFVFCLLSFPKVYLRSNTVCKTSFNAHRSCWKVCQWWWWRFWWSDATRLSEFSRSRPQGEQQQTELFCTKNHNQNRRLQGQNLQWIWPGSGCFRLVLARNEGKNMFPRTVIRTPV